MDCLSNCKQLAAGDNVQSIVANFCQGYSINPHQMPVVYYENPSSPFSRISIQKSHNPKSTFSAAKLFYEGQWISVTSNFKVVVTENLQALIEKMAYLEHIAKHKPHICCPGCVNDLMRKFQSIKVNT